MIREKKLRKPAFMVKVTVVAGLSLLTACAGHYKLLRPTEEIPTLGRLQQTGQSLPRESSRVIVGEVKGKAVRLAMEQVGDERADRTIVMVHGILSDRGSWRFMASDLGSDHELLLVDLLGCGESDRPDPSDLGPEGYSPTAHARRLLLALRQHMWETDAPDRLALVGHSLGGSVILRMMGDPELRAEFPNVVERVDRIVLFSPVDFSIEKVNPDFETIAKLGKMKTGLASALGVLRDRLALVALNSFNDPAIAAREDAQRQIRMLRRRDTRRPTKAMIRQAVPYRIKQRRPDWERIEQLVGDYRNVNVPVLILWGARDETLPVSMGYKLRAQLPTAWLRIVQESMHSLPLERPRLAAAMVDEFLRTGGDGWTAVHDIDPTLFDTEHDEGELLLDRAVASLLGS